MEEKSALRIRVEGVKTFQDKALLIYLIGTAKSQISATVF